ATGKLGLAPAQYRCRRAAVRALDWGADWCKRAKRRSAQRTAISKDAWAIATRLFISPRPLLLLPARWQDSFAHQQISASARRASPFDALKKNRDRQDRCRSWKVFRPACTVAFCSSKKTNLTPTAFTPANILIAMI